MISIHILRIIKNIFFKKKNKKIENERQLRKYQKNRSTCLS